MLQRSIAADLCTFSVTMTLLDEYVLEFHEKKNTFIDVPQRELQDLCEVCSSPGRLESVSESE